jgi:hypothetical protein
MDLIRDSLRICLRTRQAYPAGGAHYAWSGRSHAFLLLRLGLPLVGNKLSLATNGSPQPKASARNEVAAPRVVGSSGRTVIKHARRLSKRKGTEIVMSIIPPKNTVILNLDRSVIPTLGRSVILSTNRSVILSEGERAFCVPRSRRTPKPLTDPILSDPFSANPLHDQAGYLPKPPKTPKFRRGTASAVPLNDQ